MTPTFSARSSRPRTSAKATCFGGLLLLLVAAVAAPLADAGEPGSFETGKPVRERIESRQFPSVFQAWSPADNLRAEPSDRTLTRHDLAWSGPSLLGLRWDGPATGLATRFTPASVGPARQRRERLLGRNPKLVFICEIRYRDAHARYLGGREHPWWLRDQGGQVVAGWDEGGYLRLDFRQEELQRQVAIQSAAATADGLFDGVLLDWWTESEEFEGQPMLAARTNLLAAVRAAIGPDKLILVNSNDRRIPASARWVNGLFMECYDTSTAARWQQISGTLRWAEANLREPRANCVEFWYHESRQDLNLMRAVTTLSLTHGDGYCLFSDPNELPTGDHRHDWYDFWEKRLGRPRGNGEWREDGSVRRRFEGGTAVFNPMGNAPVVVVFPRPVTSLATGKISGLHTLPAADGDIYLPARRNVQ